MRALKFLSQGMLFTTCLIIFMFLRINFVFGQEEYVEPYFILNQFIASGYMGEPDNIELLESWKDTPCDTTDSDSFCIKITYTPGYTGWAGIYWQNRANNWGDCPGEDFSEYGFNQIIFWARGEKGGEVVEFKAGDISDPNKKYKDSFRATAGRLRLTKDWKRYKISLKNKNLSSVIGGFCWVASGNANPKGLTFYLDNVQYIVR